MEKMECWNRELSPHPQCCSRVQGLLPVCSKYFQSVLINHRSQPPRWFIHSLLSNTRPSVPRAAAANIYLLGADLAALDPVLFHLAEEMAISAPCVLLTVREEEFSLPHHRSTCLPPHEDQEHGMGHSSRTVSMPPVRFIITYRTDTNPEPLSQS